MPVLEVGFLLWVFAFATEGGVNHLDLMPWNLNPGMLARVATSCRRTIQRSGARSLPLAIQ
jgi:hypothetical protein